ncbi:MAG TPA: hypothetical protein VMJ32_08240 [Pirellulales bacterium]|nr:hypothetical protein [Pirellulales bacterium]
MIAIQPALLWADGGTLRLSQRSGNYQVSVFTSPAVLRCGPIDISVLVQDAATGKVRDDVPLTVRMVPSDNAKRDRSTGVLEQPASTTVATNKLFQAAVFEVSQPGMWQGRVSLSTRSNATDRMELGEKPLVFDLDISPPLPAWLELAPWIGWPFAAMALFLVHQRLASRTRR